MEQDGIEFVTHLQRLSKGALKINKFKYQVNEPSFDNNIAYGLSTAFGLDCLGFVAEKAAEQYYENHEGGNGAWPLDFNIFDSDGILLGAFFVQIEIVPTFWATEKK